jgi:hypothetical protein
MATRGMLFDTRFRPSQHHSQRNPRLAVALCSLPPPSTRRARWGHTPTSARHADGRDTLHRRGYAVQAALRRQWARNTRALKRALPELERTTARYPRRRARRLPEREPYYTTTEVAASGYLHAYVIIFVGAVARGRRQVSRRGVGAREFSDQYEANFQRPKKTPVFLSC